MPPERLQRTRAGGHRHIGFDDQSPVIEETHFAWRDLELRRTTQDISRSTDWNIHESRHVVIVHLGGRMDELETELSGHGGSSGPATPGEVWTVPADHPYASHARGGTIQFAVLSIPACPSGETSTFDSKPAALVPAAGAHDEALTLAVTRLTSLAAETDDMSQMQAEPLAYAITRHIFQMYGTAHRSRSAGSGDDPILSSHETRLLREFIFDNLGSRLSLGVLAGLVGMTTHQLLIAFRVAFGTTPAQYVILQRLRRARWLLLHTQLDITTIALRTGFSSHSHLTSTFTTRIGSPPQTFREQRTPITARRTSIAAAVEDGDTLPGDGDAASTP